MMVPEAVRVLKAVRFGEERLDGQALPVPNILATAYALRTLEQAAQWSAAEAVLTQAADAKATDAKQKQPVCYPPPAHAQRLPAAQEV